VKMRFVEQIRERQFAPQMRLFLKRPSRLLLILFSVLLICGAVSYVVLRRNPISWGMRFVPEGGLPDGYVWEHHEGADFDVFYAQHLDGKDAGIGVYLGDWPNFSYTDDLPRENGRVLGSKISWVVLDGSEEIAHTFYRTTLLEYQHGVYYPVYVHIWVYAEEKDDLYLILGRLEDLRIKPMLNIFQLLAWRLSRH